MTGGECHMKTPILNKIIKVIKSIIRLPRTQKRGRPCIYKPKTIAVMFAVMILKRIVHFKSMHKFLITNPLIAKVLGFKKSIPDRSTLSRRFKNIYDFIKAQIISLGKILINTRITKPKIISIDSTMHQACGNIWHKKHKNNNYIPDKLRNIDREAEWGYSQYKGWVYGYKTHLVATSTFKGLPIPIDCEITKANPQDNTIALPLLKRLSFKITRYILADKGYDDVKLREFCESQKVKFIVPMKQYAQTKTDRISYIRFYNSKLGQKIYARRAKTIEPLFGYIKELFSTTKLLMKGFKNVQAYLSITVWLYQILIYINYIHKKTLRNLKYLVCAV
jgi:hypothetical protein